MSDAAPAGLVVPSTQPQTIHDAIDALFADKEKAAAALPAPAVVATEGEAKPPDVVAPPPSEPAKITASDYALRLARLKRRQAPAPAPAAPLMPSPELIAKARAIEAAGGDPLKAFEAAGFDLATIVQAYDKALSDNPAEYDPAMKEIRRVELQNRQLAQRLDQYEKRDESAKDAALISGFMQDAAKRISAGGDAYEYTAAEGADGVEMVKELILAAADPARGAKQRVIPLDAALKMVEADLEERANRLLKTKKAASKFQPQTQKPGIPQQGSSASAAPSLAETRPKPVSDVITESIDALLAGR